MSASTQWYLVQGRLSGQDEDTVMPIRTASVADATLFFEQELREGGAEQHIVPELYINSVWACGQTEPTCEL